MTSNQGVSLVRPFVLAHLAEVERGEGKRRRAADDSQIAARSSAMVSVLIIPNARRAWGYSPVSDGGR